MNAITPFFAIEQTIAKATSTPPTFSTAWGDVAWGSEWLTETAAFTTQVIRASDMGYRTNTTDSPATTPYPPRVQQAFAFDAEMNLDPSQTNVALAWGTIELANAPATYDALVSGGWFPDGQLSRVLWGNKTFEDWVGQGTNRSTQAWYVDENVTLQVAPPGVIREDWSTGSPVLLNEAAATNSERNPRGDGAIAGTPGTLPTNWAYSVTAGLSTQIVGTGTESGLPYVDIRFFGTTTGASIQMVFETATAIAVSAGQVWTESFYIKLAAGSTANTSGHRVRLYYHTPAMNIATDGTLFVPTSAALLSQRHSLTVTLGASADHAFAAFACTVTNAAAVDMTLRFGGIQLEQGSAATSLILPPVGSPSATFRDADLLHQARGIYVDPSYATLQDIFSGVGGPWQLTDDRLSITLRDASYWIDRPLPRATYAGSGGYEGTAALAGTLKPIVIGGVDAPSHPPVAAYTATVKNVTPVLIDPVNLVYQVSGGQCEIITLYEGGLTGGIVFASDVADLYTGSTASGHYRTAKALGCFQLGSTPVHQITCDVVDLGLAMDGSTYSPVLQMVYYILVTLCGVPPALVASGDGVQISLIGPQTNPSLGNVGLFLGPNDAPTGAALLSRILANLGGFLVSCADAKLRLYFPAALVGTEAIAASFDDHNAASIVPVTLPAAVDPPPYRVRVGYDTNYTVQTSDLNATIDQTRKQYIAQPVLIGQANSSFLAAGLARANDLPVLGQSGCLLTGGPLSGQVSAIANAARIAGLWGVRRRTYDVTVAFQIATGLDFGSVVLLTFGFDDLGSGKRGQVVGRSFRSQDGQIMLRVLV